MSHRGGVVPPLWANKKGTGRGPFFDSCVYAAGASPPSAGVSAAGASAAGASAAGASAAGAVAPAQLGHFPSFI